MSMCGCLYMCMYMWVIVCVCVCERERERERERVYMRMCVSIPSNVRSFVIRHGTMNGVYWFEMRSCRKRSSCYFPH